MIELYALFFMAGTGTAAVFGLWNIWVWFKVGRDTRNTVKQIFANVFSRRLLTMLKAFFSNSLVFIRLFREDRVRGLVISSFIVSYLGIIVSGHLMAEALPKIGPENPLIVFFYAPFLPAYFFQVVPLSSFGFWEAFYATMDNLLVVIVLLGLVYFAYRRYVQKASILRTGWEDTVAILLPGTWIIVRTISKGVSLLEHQVPFDVAKYWTLPYLISQVLAPLNADWAAISSVLWPLAGLFLGIFMASMAVNSKLWHIFTGPLVVLANSVSRPAHHALSPDSHMAYTPKQVMEIDGCLTCGVCADYCEVYAETCNPANVYVGINRTSRSIFWRRHGLVAKLLRTERPNSAELEVFSRGVFNCTLCARCQVVCPLAIDTRSLGIATREFLVAEGYYPKNFTLIKDAIATNRNVYNLPNSERAFWTGYLPDPDVLMKPRTQAKVVYFVGCISSFSPAVQDIPLAMAQVLQHAGLDLAILGEDEWCCGYPLIVAGMGNQAKEVKRHNIERITKMGAETIVFSCPSCYHTWKNEYDLKIDMVHHTEYLSRLIKEDRIRPNPLNMTVTYHDPCDLGRNSGVYEPPREVIRSIPELSFSELRFNRQRALCCGGGGDVEIVDEDFPARIGTQVINLVDEAGSEVLVTSCQQCKRTLTKAVAKRASGSKPRVMDLAELILQSLERQLLPGT